MKLDDPPGLATPPCQHVLQTLRHRVRVVQPAGNALHRQIMLQTGLFKLHRHSKIPMSYRVALVKLLPEKFAEDFLNGNLYLNTFAYFSQLDQSDIVRSDPHDGAIEARQVLEVAIQEPTGNWIPIGGVQSPIIVHNDEISNLNILCFYTLTDRPGDEFDDRNLEFGEVAVFISNLPEFIRRVRQAVAVSSWTVAHGPVEYVKRKTHDGLMGPFRKFQDYSYQSEFRFVFTTGKRSPLRLEIGSLRDIVHVTTSSKVASIWAAMRGENA